MIEEITLEEVELRPGKFCDVFLQVNLELVDCECTGECGDGMVTERWQEVEIHEVHVESVMYWTDSDTGVEIPLVALDEQDLKRIDELASQKIESSLP
jgi:hypothetical protein